MEQEWAQTQLNQFPKGIQNAITNLHIALVIQEAEASQGESDKKGGEKK
jgi:hypothetical protein